MKTLFIWLLLYTRFDKESKTSNKEIKERFLREYPQYDKGFNNNILGAKIGLYLKAIYPNIIKSNGKDSLTYYNIKLISKPKQIVQLNRDTFLDVKIHDLRE